MGAGSVIAVTVVAALGGLLLQPTKELTFTTAGIYRNVQPISEFPYSCRKIVDTRLEGCEDLYIDEGGRNLYLACSTPSNRQHWCPSFVIQYITFTFENANRWTSVTRLNNTGRTKTDHFSVLSLDKAGADGKFGVRTLKTSGYSGTNNDEVIDLHGFDVEDIGGSKLRFFVVNHRPPLDLSGKEVDATTIGANSTVEVFEFTRGGEILKHIQTYANQEIETPNRVTATGDNGFVVTNDKSVKVGLRRELDILAGGGTLIHCQDSFCQRGISKEAGLKYPNGLTRSPKDGLYYVPSSVDGRIYVYTLMPQGTLSLVDTIVVGYPMDNLAVDAEGDIFAAAFPKALELFPTFDDHTNARCAATVMKVHRGENGYEVTKVLEDRFSEALSATTSVVHDAKTGRLWAGSVNAPWITVCDPK